MDKMVVAGGGCSLGRSERHLKKTLSAYCLPTFKLFTILFILPPHPSYSPCFPVTRWVIVNDFQEDEAVWGGEKLPAFVILTPCSMQETAIKHPVAHLTYSTDMERSASDMVGRVCCILGLAALWLRRDNKHHWPLSWLGLEKHDGTGCLSGQSWVLSGQNFYHSTL